MNAQPLSRPDGAILAWSCGVCSEVWVDQGCCTRCCACTICGQLVENRTVRNPTHEHCSDEQRSKHEAQRLEQAEALSDYDGPVCIAYTDRYYETVAEAQETEEESGWAHPCSQHPLITPAIFNAAIESACEDTFDDAYDELVFPPSLRPAIDAFVAANKDLVEWRPITQKKVWIQVEEPAQ